MNYTVIPKSIVTFQTGNSKPADIYMWATIKCCSDYKTNLSHVTEEKTIPAYWAGWTFH